VRSKWPHSNLELNAQDRVVPFSAATGTDHQASFRVATRESAMAAFAKSRRRE